jgi:DNA-directed RNA polymerase subunit RPC12/RpoP
VAIIHLLVLSQKSSPQEGEGKGRRKLMTTYKCAACSTILEVEKLPIGNIVEVKPCEACIEAAEEAALNAADVEEFKLEGTETGRTTGPLTVQGEVVRKGEVL